MDRSFFRFVQCTRVTDRQTDRQTEFSSLDRVCIPCSERGKNEWHLFPGNVVYDFFSIKVLQGGVATRVNYGRIFIDSFTANLLQSVMVKEF